MTRRTFQTTTLSLLLAAAALGVAGHPSTSEACCPAFRRGVDVKIADQDVLIVWDPTTRTEHFVRQARFAAGGPADHGAPPAGFGFLVPSPTRPDVVASNGDVFPALSRRIEPKVVTTERLRPVLTALIFLPLYSLEQKRELENMPITAMLAEGRGVDVLETKRGAGYDVAVLAATDAGALTEWLGANGYDARPELREWSEPYVKKGWVITAFKFAAEPGRVATDAVRMTFQTEAPLFPYRVPTDQVTAPGHGHTLRTFLVGPGRASGTLGEGASARPWTQGALEHAQPVARAELAALVGRALPAGALSALGDDAWLTSCADPTWPSGSDDLTFAFDPAGAQHVEVIQRVVERKVPIPLDLIGLAIGLTVLVLRRRAAK